MKKRIFTVIKEDLIYFPPALSLIRILGELGYEVNHLGQYTDTKQREELNTLGVNFVDLSTYHSTDSLFLKLRKQISFRKKVEAFLSASNISDNDIVWILNAETVCLLSSIVGKYRTILQFYEFQNPVFNWKYGLLNPFYNYEKTLHKAEKIIHCEPNRAKLTQALYKLDNPPFVIPNKPYVDEGLLSDVPEDIQQTLKQYKEKVAGKKVVIYQGIFSYNERRLEEFCDAINELPEDFVLVAMGKGGQYFEGLKKQYESDKIIFIPFVRPPYHLLFTEGSYIGVLSYFYTTHCLANSVNISYCAPNKIFEYAKYGIPMIGNDLPGLYYPFKLYCCGECIEYPMNVDHIKDCILKIDSNYTKFKEGAISYYNSVDLKEIVKNILDTNY